MTDNGKPDIDNLPSWLDGNFIERALRAGDVNSTVGISSFDITVAGALGDGYLGDMFRITVLLENMEERKMIIKCHPQGGFREKLTARSNAYSTETRMFAETLPEMFQVLEKAKPGAFRPFSAKCLHHGDDPIQFLVLEDLRHSGFTMANRQQGLDLAHCTLAMKALARFHASSLVLHEQDPAKIESYDRGIFYYNSKKYMEPFFVNQLRSLEEAVSKWTGYEEYAVKINKLRGTFFDQLSELTRRKKDEFNVLVHGDAWTNNMMFKYIDDAVVDIKFLDFQFPHFTSPAVDLNYFLYNCPDKVVRIHHMDQLIQCYHDTLVETGSILGSSKRLISLRDLHKVFDDYVLYGFMAAACTLPAFMSDKEYSFDHEKSLEINCDLFEASKSHSNPAYVEEMKRLLPVFETKGLFRDKM